MSNSNEEFEEWYKRENLTQQQTEAVGKAWSYLHEQLNVLKAQIQEKEDIIKSLKERCVGLEIQRNDYAKALRERDAKVKELEGSQNRSDSKGSVMVEFREYIVGRLKKVRDCVDDIDNPDAYQYQYRINELIKELNKEAMMARAVNKETVELFNRIYKTAPEIAYKRIEDLVGEMKTLETQLKLLTKCTSINCEIKLPERRCRACKNKQLLGCK